MRWTTVDRPTFPGTNQLGIPDLQRQATELPGRTAVNREDSGPGSLVIDRTMRPLPGSTIAFYTDDYRLEPLWSWPARALRRLERLQPAALLEPDFSQYEDLPVSVALWNLYRSRWVARYWQSEGWTVIPSLSWNSRTLECVSYGIPPESVVACEGRPRFKDPGLLLAGLQRAVKEIRPPAVLLYGWDRDREAELPAGPRYVWLPSWSPRRRNISSAVSSSSSSSMTSM